MKKISYTIFITLFSVGIIFSQTTITNNPNTRYQTMKGWGTSLAWWANLVGGMPQASIDDISKRVAVDIGLNFYRFNIGGGDDPNHSHMRKDGGAMPGYRSFYPDQQGWGVVDVTNDTRQIRVMDKLASLRAPYGDLITKTFSNSPPYFMTKSNCAAGAADGGDNIKPGYEDDFADYLASVTAKLKTDHPSWNISYIEPFNEPISNYWFLNGQQEGCYVSFANQSTILWRLWQSQQTYGISDLGRVASDCSTIAEARQNAYELWANHNSEYGGLSAIATHSYAGNAQDKADFFNEVNFTGKKIWQTETGPLNWNLPSGGQWWWRHYDIANRMVEDIRNLKSEVWCNWQALAYDDGWSLVQQTNWNENNPYQAATLKNTRSFYIYKQIVNHIKVGYTQIANGDPNSMTFVSPDNKKIVVVITNNTSTAKDYSVDLSNFQTITYFDTYRTSGYDDSGENAKLLTYPSITQKGVLSANKIAYSAPAWSVTTFVASVDTPVSVSLNDFESVTPNTVVRYGSDLSIVNNPLVNGTNATTKTARLARTTSNWYELFAFDIDPIAVPANTTYYLHALVKYDSAADIAIRYDATNRDDDGTTLFRALNPYTSSDAGQWKDLVFAIAGGPSGVTVNAIQFHPDLGFENTPAVQVLNNSTSFGYIDELLVSTSSTERTTVAAPTLASTLANFDGITPTASSFFGANNAVVSNPYPNGGNTSANVIRIGRTGQNWYELTKFNIPDFALSAGETKYIHIAVNYPSLPVASIRIDVDNTSAPAGQVDILPVNTYASASNGHWQDLVFAVSGGAKGLSVNNLVLVADVGNYAAPPAGQVLDNTTNYAYIDNIILNNSATPLFTARTSLQAITLYATSNTNPTPRLVDYTNAGVTGVTANNLTSVNTAIDAASPAPTTLLAVQTVVNQALALAVITSYASSNTNPVPTVSDYTNAGVIGVTANNLTSVNTAIDAASPAPTTLLTVQTVVNQALALAVITSYASSNTNPVPTVSDYTNAGVIGVTTNNLTSVNTAIDTASPAPSTLLAVQAVVSPVTALALITSYASSNTNPTPRLVDYTNAGVTGVTTTNLLEVNVAIDRANPAPTSLSQVQTIVNQVVLALNFVPVSLNDFESVTPNTVVRYGSDLSIVNNPLVNGTNATAKTARLARTTTNWYELFAFNIDPIAVPANTTYYLHALVKYDTAADIAIRYDATNRDTDGVTPIRASNPYTSSDAGQWKDLVFAIAGGASGVTVNAIQFHPDLGFENTPAVQVLNNSTSFGYIDELLLDGTSIARTTVAAPTLASTLANFDGISPVATTAYGATQTLVANPYPNGGNTSANVIRIGRTGQNWYELTKFNIPDFALSAGETKYIHIAVNYPALPVASIRIDVDNTSAPAGQVDILPVNTYASASNGHWQDLVFAVSGGAKGLAVNNLVLVADVGNYAAPPAGQVLDNTTNYAYIDNIILNNSATPLFTARTSLQAITLYATSNTNPTPRLVDYTNAGVTGVTAENLSEVNTAIDAASPAPTTLLAVQTVVNQALALAVITSYASSNTNPVPTVSDYTNAGVTGVTTNNLTSVNTAIDAASPAPTTLLAVQTVVNQALALAVITSYASSNTNPVPTVSDYTNAGVTGVTTNNLTSVNTAIDAASPAPTTLLAVQTVVNQALALAVITSYASSNTNPVPTVSDYTNAGVTGVTTTNLLEVNVAIDRANPAPTSLSQLQTIVNQVVLALNFVPVSLNDFESVTPNTVVRYGSDLSIVNNPLVNGTNATAKTARLARTTTNWYELFAFDITPIAVPANTTYYLHALVKYDSATDIAIRYDATNRDTDGVTPIRASNPYTSSDAGQWKDLVFAIAGGASGVTVNAIQFHPDLGFENTPAVQVLNNSTSFGYIDELLLDGTSIARTTVAAPTLASTLANFDGISPVATTAYGATQTLVANPYPNGGNTSANVIRIGRTGQNWYELTKFNIPDFALSAGETKYIHIAVNYPALPVASIRIDVDNTSAPAGQVDILPVNTYASASNGHWQDLVFAVSGGAKGLAVNNLVLVADVGNYAAPPAGQVLDNTTNYAYIDNIILNNSATPLFTARTSLQAITLYATSNTNPTPRLVDYTNAGVTGVTAENLSEVNTAIDTASPAPSTLAEIQAVVDSLFNIVWTGATSSSWSVESNWNKGVLPDSNSVVTIPSEVPFQPTLATNSTIKTLEIQNGSSLIVASGSNLTVKGTITNSGTMTLASNANLIQEGTINSNTGIIKVTRNSNALSRLDYTIWSSPVAGQNLLSFSPRTITSRFYSYNESTNFYNVIADPSSVSFAQATGYLIRMPNDAVTAPLNEIFTGVFTGIPNNGDITKAITYSGSELFGYNIVGNPYPSTIDADTFLAVNSENIENSLYFWRKINDASGSAYAVYNPLGGTMATPSSDLPNGIIQVGQGFLIKAKKNTNLIFNNTMRVANNANQIFRIKQFEKDRIWLNLSNPSGKFSQTLIGYVADATLGVDRYDAEYINDSATSLTSSINAKEYTIQGRPTFDILDIVPLNFKSDTAGEYTIAIDRVDGVFAKGQDVYLVDSKTGTETDLKIGGYTFTAAAGVDNNRFYLKYQKALKVDTPTLNENNVKVYRNNGILHVNSSNVVISNIKIFDMQGKLILEQKDVNSTKSLIHDLKETDQVLLVSITGEDHNVVIKKILN